MPQSWDCNRTADFLTELDDLCKRYGLDKDDVIKAMEDHKNSCRSCNDKIEKFIDKYEGGFP
jgi:cupin superfamily acireductone dioxygenase involved in methionine salvage